MLLLLLLRSKGYWFFLGTFALTLETHTCNIFTNRLSHSTLHVIHFIRNTLKFVIAIIIFQTRLNYILDDQAIPFLLRYLWLRILTQRIFIYGLSNKTLIMAIIFEFMGTTESKRFLDRGVIELIWLVNWLLNGFLWRINVERLFKVIFLWYSGLLHISLLLEVESSIFDGVFFGLRCHFWVFLLECIRIHCWFLRIYVWMVGKPIRCSCIFFAQVKLLRQMGEGKGIAVGPLEGERDIIFVFFEKWMNDALIWEISILIEYDLHGLLCDIFLFTEWIHSRFK